MLAEALPSDSRVWSFTSAGNWEVAADPLHRFWESFTPVHANILRAAMPELANRTDEELAEEDRKWRVHGAGLGISFASQVADATGGQVGLLPCAHGGTSLAQWSQELAHMGGASLYGGMLERVKRAGGTVRGLIWYQGESDANPTEGPTYADRFAAWVEAARRDLGIADLPVVVVQLGRWVFADGAELAPNWDQVRKALLDLPGRVPNTGVVTAIDLPLADGIHISASGLVRLGRRCYKAMAALTGMPGGNPGPRATGASLTKAPNGLGTVTVKCSGVTGGWLAEQPMYGFEVRNAGVPVGVVGAETAANDPSSIRLVLEQPAEGPVEVAYALGLNPPATVVDRDDMALPAFGWIPAE